MFFGVSESKAREGSDRQVLRGLLRRREFPVLPGDRVAGLLSEGLQGQIGRRLKEAGEDSGCRMRSGMDAPSA